MSSRTRVALGLTAGYLLGRYRKAGWLAAIAALMATRRLGATISSSPELKKLAEQGREAAIALAGNRLQGVTDRIHATTESLRPPMPGRPGASGESGGQDQDQDQEQDRAAAEESPAAGEPEPDQQRSRRGRERTATQGRR
jgi:hypothetical protein